MVISTIIQQRGILVGLIVILFLLTIIRHRLRYILIIPLGIAAAFTLVTIIFPLYEQGPNFTEFYRAQESTIFFTATETSTDKLLIQNKMNIYELDGQTHTQQTVPKNLETTISFVASSKTGDQTCILLLPEGTSIEIFPQTQMSFLAQYPKISIEKKQGQAKYIASDNYSPWQLFLTGISKQDAQKNQFQQDFETKKIQSIGEQGEGIFMQNAYLKAVNKGMLHVLARLWPARFQDNITNFEAFTSYIPTEQIRATDTTVDPNIQADVATQAKRGREETKLYQRRNNFFK